MLKAMQVASVETSLTTVEYAVQPDDLNGYKLLHGGRLLTLADETAYKAARYFCGRDCLTVAVHHASFHRPAELGETLRLQAMVALTGISSIWVAVEAFNIRTEKLMDAVFVFVAVDDKHRPVCIPRIEATSPAGKALQEKIQKLKTTRPGGHH
ncbi:MAG: hypothetical protein COS82_02730 [Zetaproteobacteria bacterium CG06_land_8_20_14_3_00_59_53]|nr:MAG: hypothetical protein AUK36_08985 [Zetaproteobacteria bacterium CG2_30_59_37]PIO90852.1 MAG: hypothetical protein COX56_00620 [Zetaproteobacteria bacterium CG23_combo_of_CG06-09_8_20_14_all_59_86]PIQ64673.1 MAG: hypothetical protein COV97_07855 [Zetaproteobacteria bacterium CG11_big_fil_rev_8_21_14_0_20_59_439]PIU71162.1 MAG: hypothetical protein COS82_02730 [Zetaproteobacteria bacterium CG06_land_8_20_14_3_00_59_53]PIU96655.1 MAG: hypothetical protein COS62_07930 [Zetaproteobacteria bac